jgi:hypothetical protein
MEACATAHHWAQEFIGCGLISAKQKSGRFSPVSNYRAIGTRGPAQDSPNSSNLPVDELIEKRAVCAVDEAACGNNPLYRDVRVQSLEGKRTRTARVLEQHLTDPLRFDILLTPRLCSAHRHGIFELSIRPRERTRSSRVATLD